MAIKSYIFVEVAYALSARQQIIGLQVPLGTTAFNAVKNAGITDEYSVIALQKTKMGIVGKRLGEKGWK